MIGRYARVEPLDIDSIRPISTPPSPTMPTVATGPISASTRRRPSTITDLARHRRRGRRPLFHAIHDESGAPAGVAAFLRIDPVNGVIEVGHINFAPRLKRTRVATEAMYLMMRRVFEELGYRRYEWKCDSLNAPSRAAATRFGFTFEGIFRQAIVYKGRNRDTAWFSIIDREWPAVKAAFEAWLDPSNFDEAGRQRAPLTTHPVSAR